MIQKKDVKNFILLINATKLKMVQVMDFIRGFFGIKKMYRLLELQVLSHKDLIFILKENILDQM